jgi:uncharacterized phiE125 gp8 family phage protein
MANIRSEIYTQPASEPLSTAEAKEQLRWTHSAEDALVDRMVKAARQTLEDRCQMAFISQVWRTRLPHWPNGCYPFNYMDGHHAIRLARYPVISVDSILYDDEDGNQQTLASSVYELETGSNPPLVRLAYDQSWPSIREGANSIIVEYTVGYADASTFAAAEPQLMQAMQLLVDHYGKNRSAVVTGTISSVLPEGVDALVRSRMSW